MISEFREAFLLFDKDDNGSIDSTELGTIMNTLGHPYSPQDLTDMMKEVDTDGNVCVLYYLLIQMVMFVFYIIC